MKALVIYVSRTGKTRKIAECIFTGMAPDTALCELRPFIEVDTAALGDYDLVGLGAPDFDLKIPSRFRDFMESLPALHGRHWFIFCCHGNPTGRFFTTVTLRLAHKGARVIGYFNGCEDLTPAHFSENRYRFGFPETQDLACALRFGQKIVGRSRCFSGHDEIACPRVPCGTGAAVCLPQQGVDDPQSLIKGDRGLGVHHPYGPRSPGSLEKWPWTKRQH